MLTHPRRRWLNAPVLFLDYDGVLHPDEVRTFRVKRKLHILLTVEGMSLFEWADLLRPALEAAPYTAVVLSTTWVKTTGFQYAKAQLPDWLQDRVVGGTWHQRDAQIEGWGRWWEDMYRHEQIRHYVEKRQVSHWLAVDDNDKGWPETEKERLIKTDSYLGLAQRGKVGELTARLVANERAWLASPLAAEHGRRNEARSSSISCPQDRLCSEAQK